MGGAWRKDAHQRDGSSDAESGKRLAPLSVVAARLAVEFRRFEIRTIRLHRGEALSALRRAGASEPGLYAVITDDPAEMRAVLRGAGPDG